MVLCESISSVRNPSFAMADLAADIDNVMKIHQSFVTTVHEKWTKTDDPGTIMAETVEDVDVDTDAKLNVRLRTQENQVFEHDWTFVIVTTGKPLLNVALMLNDHRTYFGIKSVTTTDRPIGTSDGQEWSNTVSITNQLPAMPARGAPNDIKISADSKQMRYVIQVGFAAINYGTFRQIVVFGFGDYPVICRNLCADCAPAHDIDRLIGATNYVLGQKTDMWNVDNCVKVPFESPFVYDDGPKHRNVTKVYPCPDEVRFFMTHATLTENCLTPNNYRGRLHELLYVEELAKHEQIARYNEVMQLRLSSNYNISTDSNRSVTTKYAPPGELFAEIPLVRDATEDMKSGRLLLRCCQHVYIKPLGEHSSSNVIYEAHVEAKANRMVYVRLSKTCVERLELQADTNLNAQVQFILDRLPFCEYHRAIDCLPNTSIVFPSFSSNVHIPWTPHQYWNKQLDPRLNPNQREAIRMMAMPFKAHNVIPPVLVLGPYGTGKTFTIAQGLQLILKEVSNSKILLCTHSNSAADLYVKEYFDPWCESSKNEKFRPLRIYYKGRARNTVHPTVQQYCIFDKNGRFRDPTQEDIEKSSFIITTLATSCCLMSLDIVLTHIVIDEAAQVMECEALMPLAMASYDTRLIFAGDQMQLAPEIYSDLAQERGLGYSLLERLYNMYPPTHSCRILLWQNYRAHADIVQLTSELFYFGSVNTTCNLPAHPLHSPLTFYSIRGKDVQDIHSMGFYNDAEAYELAERVQELIKNWPDDLWGPYGENSVGVVAYYSEQVHKIRNELRNRKLYDVSVERVLNVQGKQFTSVFISTVRTRDCCKYMAECKLTDYGFLTNHRLLNAAITRAKCLVAVVGDPIALLTTGSCRNLWRRFLEVATFHGMETNLRYHLENIVEVPFTMPLNPLAQEFIPRSSQSSSHHVEYYPVLMPYIPIDSGQLHEPELTRIKLTEDN